MTEFALKRGDTRPILRVVLRNPDGSVHNLTGSTDWKLHIWLANGTKLVRNMTKIGADADGTLEYIWQESDWDAGNLVVSPNRPLTLGIREHWMEYEVVGGNSRLTVPNGNYHTLRILSDIGQGL